MSVNGREIEGLLSTAREQLELYKTANIGELLAATLASVDESTKTIELAFSRLDRIKQQLKAKQAEYKDQVAEIADIEREFAARREEQYLNDSQRLQELIDSPARAELLHTREEIAKINAELNKSQQSSLKDTLGAADSENVLKLQVYRSLGLELDKVRNLQRAQVWDILETLWG